ncbi:MAG TPA: catalase-related domain-containing protein [Flavisolibacter sp.]|nr:catalase-related domain-containing protein [Flavisolibacter sp.]
MRLDGNGGDAPNYFPYSFDSIKPDPAYKASGFELDSLVADHYDRNAEGENDHYSQPGIFYREVLSEQDKKNLVSNIAGARKSISGPKKDEIINRQLCHFFRADIGLGMAVAKALGLDMNTISTMHSATAKAAEKA